MLLDAECFEAETFATHRDNVVAQLIVRHLLHWQVPDDHLKFIIKIDWWNFRGVDLFTEITEREATIANINNMEWQILRSYGKEN